MITIGVTDALLCNGVLIKLNKKIEFFFSIMELLVILDKSPFSVQIPTFRIQLLSEQQHVKKIHELHHSDHKNDT